MDTVNKTLLMMLVALFGLIATPQLGYAQDDTTEPAEITAPAETEEAAAPEETGKTVWGYFQAGGWAMWILLVFSIMGVGLIIYNALMIREKPFLRPDLVEQLKPALEGLQFDEARRICEDNPTVITNIIDAGLDRIDGDHVDPTAMKEAMEESSTEELAAPFIMINMLSLVATLSPMVGLLGTVSGMVKAFDAIAAQGMGQPQQLADNISEALITTAGGLTVAIPAMFAYIFFKNVYGKISSRVDKQVGDLYHDMMKGLRRISG